MKKLIFILVLFLVSCGSRKVAIQKENTKIEQTTNVQEDLSIVSQITQTSIDTSFCYEEQFEPIDSTQPMVIDRKNGVFKNTRFKTFKTKKGISTNKKEESVLNQRKSTLNEIIVDKVVKEKNTDRKMNPNWVWILFVFIVGYLIYRHVIEKK